MIVKYRWPTRTFHGSCRFQSFLVEINPSSSFVSLLFSFLLSFPFFFFSTSISTDLHDSGGKVRWNPRTNSILRSEIDLPVDTTLHYLSSAIGIFTATLYHLPCTVRDTICIEARVGLMESPGSRERNHTWMGFDIISISYRGLSFVRWNSKSCPIFPRKILEE